MKKKALCRQARSLATITAGHKIPCPGSGQDGEFRKGVPWPVPRFEPEGDAVLDRLTGLILESLVDCSTHSPALPAGHPFRDVREGYWSSTTSIFEPDWAWALYLAKGAVGVGQKRGAHFHVWAVQDTSIVDI